MKRYRLHWLGNAEPTDVVGDSIVDAVTRAGYGRGAMRALDYWEEIPECPPS